MGRPLDLLLRGGTLVDGTGAPAREADVAVVDGRIAVLPAGADATAAEILDATGRVVAPGFIDVHTHSDALAAPHGAGGAAEAADTLRLAPLLQGVTTEICGNCGTSLFPSLPERLPELAEHLRVTFGLGPVRPAVDFDAFAAGRDPPCATPTSPRWSATARCVPE